MNKELKKLYERFETEVWLYLDGSLSREETKFWDEQLSKNTELKKLYKDTLSTLNLYNEQEYPMLEDKAFEEMLGKATYKKQFHFSISDRLTRFFELIFSNNLSTVKIVVTGALAVVALLVLLTTEKPNAVKSIGQDILSWQGTALNEQIYGVDESIETLSMEEWEKYDLIQTNYDEWERSYFLLNNEINQLQKDIENTSL